MEADRLVTTTKGNFAMGIEVIEGERGTEPMGKLLRLPITTTAGEAAALRAELVARLRERRGTVVTEMAEAVHRAGLTPVLGVGEVPVAERLDVAVRIMLAAWEHHRPLEAVELDALADLGADVARAGVPLWRLLNAVHHASRAGWHYALDQAVAVSDGGRRPAAAVQLVADLSVDLFDIVARIQSQVAAGYAGSRGLPASASPATRAVTPLPI